MTPESSKSEGSQTTQGINTEIHPEGVRPFTRELDEKIARGLEIPVDPSAIDPITGNVDFPRLPLDADTSEKSTTANSPATTEATPAVTEAVPENTETTHKWKNWVAGLVGSAVLAGGGVVVGSALSGEEKSVEPRTDQNTSASPNPTVESPASETNGGAETIGEAIIANLNKKPTPEQIEYVIDNPVNIAEASTVGDAFAALGDRLTVVMNSGEPDFDAPVGEDVFTPETQASYDAMGPSVMDATSPNYEAMLSSLRSRRNQIGAMFMLDPSAETEVNLLPTSDTDTPLQLNSTVDVSVDTVWTTNQPDNRSSDGKYNNDYSSTMTLSIDAAGDVRIYNSTNVTDIGNIG